MAGARPRHVLLTILPPTFRNAVPVFLSSSHEQVLTEKLRTAPQLLFQKVKLLNEKLDCHFISSKMNTVVVLNAASSYSDSCIYCYLLGINPKPSSAPEQVLAEHLTMPALYPRAGIPRTWHPGSI